MGTRPHFSGTESNIFVANMWRFLVISLILSSSILIRTSYAKGTKDTDLTFDDINTSGKETSAVKQANSTNKINGINEFGSHSVNILDDSNVVQSVEDVVDRSYDDDDDDDDVDGSNKKISKESSEETETWWTQSVRRVRREISRLFSGSEESEKNEEQPEEPKVKKNKKIKDTNVKKNLKSKRFMKKAHHKHPIDNQGLADRSKRQLSLDWWSSNDGDDDEEDPENGSGDDDAFEDKRYRLQVVLGEYWNPNFKNPHSPEFKNLSNALLDELNNIFDREYKRVYDDYTMNGVVSNIAKTNDHFKVYVTVDLSIPHEIDSHDFAKKILEDIQDLYAIGSLSADTTDFSFQPLEYYNSQVIDRDEIHILGSHTTGGGASHCDEHQFTCSNGACVPLNARCDEFADCSDGSDEIGCPNGGFSTPAYVPSYPGQNNWPDDRNTWPDDRNTWPDDRNTWPDDRNTWPDDRNNWPDENHWPDENGESGDGGISVRPAVRCRGDDVYICPRSRTEICDVQKCDGNQDCPFGEDEEDCGGDCLDDEFSCDSGFTCITLLKRCDGVIDCNDETDELECPSITVPYPPLDCQTDEYQCGDGTCISRNKICDRIYDCRDGDDESNCDTTITPDHCSYDEFFCDNSCHPRRLLCDGTLDCLDRTDEFNCHYNVTTPLYPPPSPCYELTCPGSGKCFLYSEKCDGISDCDDGYDERDCCNDDQFRCNDGTCIADYDRCNRRRDCPDGSDEINCHYGCLDYQWECNNGQCISTYARCDGRADCSDYSDERDCPTTPSPSCGPYMFRCENGQCISINLRCNRRVDCPYDMSDELDCENEITSPEPPSDPQLDLKTYPSNQIIKESREVVFRCRDEGPTRAKVKWSRPGGRPLPPGFTDVNGRLEIPNIRTEDAGEYICEAVGYPSYTRGQSVTVHLTVEKYNPFVDRPPTACKYHEATCMNNECIPKTGICDGIPHCSDGSDELNCSHRRKCQPNEFMCKNTRCIDRTWRCDSEDDCGDRSDEESCDPNPSESPCRYDEFQCRSGHCIPKSFHCDATNDCHDGSDEIGCIGPSVISPPPPVVDIPVGGTLNITCRGTGVPTPLIVWRLNWGHVPDNCISTSEDGFGTLICTNMQKEHSGAYSCEIINTKDRIFVTPDTIVTVITGEPSDVCPAGYFNKLAARQDECINCFCFGVSNQCKSADLYVYNLPPPVTSNKVVGVEIKPYETTIGDFPEAELITLRHGVQFRASNVPYTRQIPYLALPDDYQGSQLKSYGGYLKYEAQFIGFGSHTDVPDVILTGNGYTLTYKGRQRLESNVRNQISVRFIPGYWQNADGRTATREEIMMALANVDNLLLRLQYIDETEREVEITHITMDSAGFDDFGKGSASLVEQCTCPTGYMGISCERCAPGYIRQPGGPWLGRCVPEPLPTCPTGMYGDPNRGISCRPCPCPLTNRENNFARSCSLGPDDDVICDCQPGYTGRRCEMCEAGYEGDPFLPSGCYPIPTSQCNPAGTNYTNPDGSCQCKSLVTGAYCDRCAPSSFNLNSGNPLGCIECFCSGVTTVCSSSDWYRDTIQANFMHGRTNEVEVIANPEIPVRNLVDVVNTGDELRFQGSTYNTDVLYWSLPSKFLGNKLGAFGGTLSYTLRYVPMPGGLMSKNTAPDVVIKSANDIVLVYFRKSDIPPSVLSTNTIPMIDTEWRRQDRGMYNRAYFLMALANIEAIYIKATYTTTTQEAALSHVSLDTATRTNIGTKRALEVEQCSCPSGYTGLSCENCAPGFKRDPEAGLYLGLCEECECNGHSTECDPESGICSNCRDNTVGEFCELCAPNFEGNATDGTPNGCKPKGAGIRECECDARGYARCNFRNECVCKRNVVGYECNICREGTFNLQESNPDGCSECFCSGVSTSCSLARNYREEQLFLAVFHNHQPSLTRDEGNEVLSESFDLDPATNEISVYRTIYETLHWSLPSQLLGNQIKSYGRKLRFTATSSSAHGTFRADKDIILQGNGIKLFWNRPRGSEEEEEFNVQLDETESWYKIDESGVSSATRIDFLTALANLDRILIRANNKIPVDHISLRNVILDTATPGTYIGFPAPGIEVCICPSGYEGTSCETCAKLYYRNISHPFGTFGSCLRCPCKEDGTESCNMLPNGHVQCNCIPGYVGDRCQYAEGTGTTTQRPHPLPEITIAVTVTSPLFNILDVGETIQLHCTGKIIRTQIPIHVQWHKLEGELPYDAIQDRGVLTLSNLQVHDSGTYVCQAHKGDEVVEQRVTVTVGPSGGDREPPTVVVTPPSVDIEEFKSIVVDCNARGHPTPIVTWSRTSGSLPYGVEVVGHRLIFNSIQRSDAGSYICHAENIHGRDDFILHVYVRPSMGPTEPPHAEIIYIEPPSYYGHYGDIVTLTCHLRTSIYLTYTWLKDDREIYRSRNIDVNDNVLVIYDATPADSGTYTCRGTDPHTGNVYVTVAYVTIEEGETSTGIEIRPQIIIHEHNYNIIQGKDLSVACETTGTPYPAITWTKLNEALDLNVQQTGNILRIINAQPSNRGVYVCVAENLAGTDQASIIVDVEPRERPLIEIHPREPQIVNVGDSAMLSCRAVAGIPEPTITWRRLNGQPLPSNVREDYTGTLTFMGVEISNNGEYECRAENVAGFVTATAVLTVVQPPTIRIYPNDGDIEVTEGDELKLICTSTGFPDVSVKWVDASIPLLRSGESAARRAHEYQPVASQSEAVLDMYHITQNDARLYTCVASNIGGEDRKYVNLRVKSKRGDVGPHDRDQPPDIPSTPGGHRVYNTEIGDRTTFSCNVEGPTYAVPYWERIDGHPLPPNSQVSGSDLIIYSITKEAAGIYQCVVYDRHGKIALATAELRLSPLPHVTFSPPMPMTVRAGENVEVFCNATGEQPIDVEWHAENHRRLPYSVRADGPYLRFHAIQLNHTGRYYCSASNRHGNVTKVAEVIVQRGAISHFPSVPSNIHEVREGEGVKIECKVPYEFRRSNYQFLWRREDGPLPLNHETDYNFLIIPYVHYEDQGRYVCELITPEGITTNYFDLFVKRGNLPALKLDPPRSYIRVGESTEVECHSADGYIDVIWERADGRRLPSNIRQIGNKLIIENADISDSGDYICKCRTGEGQMYSTNYELNIQGTIRPDWTANEVSDTPKPSKKPKVEHAEVGSTIILRCDVEDPRASIKWNRQYGQIQHGKELSNNQLILNNVQAKDAGTYICTSTFNGISVDTPTILVVTGAIPHFHQAPISYMTFPTLEGAFIKINLDITFKPEQSNGLILYNGEKKGNGDYISLSLNERYPEFRFDFGNTPTIIRSERPITLGEWHTIKISRSRRDGYMLVDNQPPVAFPPPPLLLTLDLIENLYIGAVPRWMDLPLTALEHKTGFVGCVSRLVLQEKVIELNKDAIQKEGISSCEPCADDPCQNDGICLETQTEIGYTCICQEGFTGRNCTIPGSSCTPDICGSGRCENTDTGMECFCPLNKTGDRCQYVEYLQEGSLSFKDGSYAAYKTPRPTKLNIKFHIRPNTLDDSIVLYVAESERVNGDFAAVVIKDKHLEFRVNTGGRLKPVIIKSMHPLVPHKWTEVEIGRKVGEGYLKVGNEPEQTGKAAGPTRSLYLKTHLYIGGYDKRILLNRDIDVFKGFDGCISNLQESNRKIRMIADVIDAANVQNCGDYNEITPPSINGNHLQNGDACLREPCENGGTCILHGNDFTCDCPLNYAGKYCQEHIRLDLTAHFTGNGYLELNHTAVTKKAEQNATTLAVLFSTTEPNGLILWYGQPKGERFTHQDFLALAIVDGILEFVFRVDGEEYVIRQRSQRVDNGRRHIAVIKRNTFGGFIELDHVSEAESMKPTGRKEIHLPGNIFLGGAPDLANFTGQRYRHGFKGCIHTVEGETDGGIILGRYAVSAVNVNSCPNFIDESLEGTEPPVV